jgi:hypothetical protein
VSHKENRDNVIIEEVKRELVGPAIGDFPEELDTKQNVVFKSHEETWFNFIDKDTKEEILRKVPPFFRYSVGVLNPKMIMSEEDQEAANIVDENKAENNTEILTEDANKEFEKIANGVSRKSKTDDELDDSEIKTDHMLKPSSMGLSFLIKCEKSSKLKVKVTGARYEKLIVKIADIEQIWWLRRPVDFIVHFSGKDILTNKKSTILPEDSIPKFPSLKLSVELITRPISSNVDERLLTVSLINRNNGISDMDEEKDFDLKNSAALFQSKFSCSIIDSDLDKFGIKKYITINKSKTDEEEDSLDLLYRDYPTFSIGHGTSADWINIGKSKFAKEVFTSSFPNYEMPSITPDVFYKDEVLSISMSKLADLNSSGIDYTELIKLLSFYNNWIDDKKSDLVILEKTLSKELVEAGKKHIAASEKCLKRMQEGLELIKNNKDKNIEKAFSMANRAIILQQFRSGQVVNNWVYTNSGRFYQRNLVDPMRIYPASNEEILNFFEQNKESSKGKWRAFQIAFILMNIKSIIDGKDPDRDNVELIWFPTGGGKTEAYLGMTAFSSFYERLKDPERSGVSVLMRYTLRLLTAQQFQRAAGLICSMEYIRKENTDTLGDLEYSIGLWLGGDSTPNNRASAKISLKELKSNYKNAENKFIIDRCPWCLSQLGPLRQINNIPKGQSSVLGYEFSKAKGFFYKCENTKCSFQEKLPIYTVDTEIYDKRPTLVIGTVDKFAIIAWNDKCRSLFGIGDDGKRLCAPPSMIIQDELHLISGPLGSMVGLYEGVIEELCREGLGEDAPRPKIICSTATIRSYKDQIHKLYGRKNVTLFPQPGLSSSDSFFATFAKEDDGSLKPGRKYIGVYAPALATHYAAQVRVFSALLQAPLKLPENERDPWWTLLCFYNSLRELGTAISLFQSTIPDFLKKMANRDALDLKDMRRMYSPMELTGRLKSDKVPMAIANLEREYSKESKAVDVCMASNIIEVGVDIGRLSLLGIVGQPKSTSQYIQVSGRVGREWWDRPGAVFVIYGVNRPRDRSHYEKFRSFHEKIYAEVEPTSVTPFALPVLERALHALMIAYIRQRKEQERLPFPIPEDELLYFKSILRKRILDIQPDEIDNFEYIFDKRMREWRRWEAKEWKGNIENQPLMRFAGNYVDPSLKNTWPTPASLRNVDAACEMEITSAYSDIDQEEEELIHAKGREL